MRPLILIVDADPRSCDLMAQSFAYEGFAAIGADKTEKALRFIHETVPSVAVISLSNSCAVGWDFWEAIALLHPEIPVILVAEAGLEIGVLTSGYRLSACALLVRPVRFPVLLGQVKTLAGRAVVSFAEMACI